MLFFYDFDEYLKNNHPVAEQEFSLTNQAQMSLSEMASIIIGYHQSKYKCFKFYYQEQILIDLKSYFPNAISYERFVILKHRLKPYLESFMGDTRLAEPTDGNYIDASKLEVCHLMRVPIHKVFKGQAKYGRTMMGRFFGFKFHLIINHLGQIINVFVSTGKGVDNNKDLL